MNVHDAALPMLRVDCNEGFMSLHPHHLGIALGAFLVLAGGQAFGQDKPAAQAPQGAPPQGPFKIELQASQADWTKVCGKGNSNGKELCFTTRDFFAGPNQPPVALAVYEVKGDDTRIIRVLLPTAVLLQPGVRMSVDKGAQQEGKYEFCLPNGCFAESKVKPATVEGMKKGTLLNIVAKNMANDEVTFTVPLAGFGKTYDGPAIDPKVLQQQQEAQQAELQKQLEKQAKQRQQTLDQGGGAAPAPAAPAPAPAPKP